MRSGDKRAAAEKEGGKKKEKKEKRKGQQRIEQTAETTRAWEGNGGKAVFAAETRVESGNASTFFGRNIFLRVGVGFFIFIFLRKTEKKYMKKEENKRRKEKSSERQRNIQKKQRHAPGQKRHRTFRSPMAAWHSSQDQRKHCQYQFEHIFGKRPAARVKESRSTPW